MYNVGLGVGLLFIGIRLDLFNFVGELFGKLGGLLRSVIFGIVLLLML